MLPEWIYSPGFYFEPREGGEERTFGFYDNKQTNKQKQKMETAFLSGNLGT